MTQRTQDPDHGATPRQRVAQLWGKNYTPRMDAEMTVLERGGVTIEDIEWANSMVDRHDPRDEWGYFRHCCLMRAADRVEIRREAGIE